MIYKGKFILGLSEPKSKKKFGGDFTLEERHFIVQEYLSSNLAKSQIWEKYTGSKEEHGTILRWLRTFGYKDKIKRKTNIFATNIYKMKSEQEKNKSKETFEDLQMKKRIEELEKKLKTAEMKSIAYSTMIDIAEKEFKIKIRKK